MRIDIADPAAEESLPVDEIKHLRICRDRDLRQFAQCTDHLLALPEIAERQFSKNVRMPQNFPPFEQPRQDLIAETQMIDPDRGVDENHLG